MRIIAKNNVQALIAPTRVAVLWSDARMVIAAVDRRQAISIVTANLNTAILLPMMVSWDINIISSTKLVFTVTVVVLPHSRGRNILWERTKPRYERTRRESMVSSKAERVRRSMSNGPGHGTTKSKLSSWDLGSQMKLNSRWISCRIKDFECQSFSREELQVLELGSSRGWPLLASSTALFSAATFDLLALGSVVRCEYCSKASSKRTNIGNSFPSLGTTRAVFFQGLPYLLYQFPLWTHIDILRSIFGGWNWIADVVRKTWSDVLVRLSNVVAFLFREEPCAIRQVRLW